MKNILIISVLGALGVLSRHFLENRLGDKLTIIPLGTFVANIAGCFIAGLIYQAMMSKTSYQEFAAMMLVGLCGGLTTFSGYALSSLNDISNGEYGKAALYLFVSPMLGMIFAFFGIKLGKLLFL